MRNKDKTKKFTSPTFFPSLLHSFILNSFLPSLWWLGEWGLKSVHHSSCWLLLFHNFFCSSMWPFPWDSPSQTVPAQAFSQGTILQEQIAAAGVPHRSYLLPGAAPAWAFHRLQGSSCCISSLLLQLLHSTSYFFLNIFSQRCHQHHCWAQAWPALSGCVQHGASPDPFSGRPPQQYLLLQKPWHLHPIQDLNPNTWKKVWLFGVS